MFGENSEIISCRPNQLPPVKRFPLPVPANKTSKPPAEITKTREIIDKILNIHENGPLFIEKVLFS